MTEDSVYSLSGDVLSPDTNLNINIGGPQGSDLIVEDDGNELDVDSTDINNNREELTGMNDEDHLLELNDCEQVLEIIENDPEDGVSDGNDYPPPVAGMEFETYDDAYNYYNCYAKELGFAIRVKSSWTKRNSKEKRGAVLCCNCEGFKMIKEVSARRKETRTGCLAMIRLRLVESNRWRVDEVKLEHNHSFDPTRANNSKSHKKMDSSGNKRKVEANLDVEVQTIKLYRTPVSNFGYGSSNSEERETGIGVNSRLKLDKGDAEIIQNYFCKAQLKDPNFIYLMDFNDDGHLRNVLWMHSRSRASYTHFGDVVTFESRDYDVPFFAFVGINHHGESILFGCGLIADETFETYIWLFRAWLTCMSGRPPQTIITSQSKTIQTAISEVFPRAHHRFNLAQTLFSSHGELSVSKTFLERIIYDSLRVEEFKTTWEDLMQQIGENDHELFRSLYETRERWAPVFMKDTFLAGISGFCRDNTAIASFFDGYIHQRTTLKEFFDTHEAIIEEKRQKESLSDTESQEQTPMLKTRSYYEVQLSKIYTKSIFSKFQQEVLMMSNCFSSVSQIQSNGTVSTYLIKEHDREGDFEVMYDKFGPDIRCLCSCFNFSGYLCRHALCVLNCNRVEEIPFQFILARWRKDLKRVYVADFGSDCIHETNPVQRFDHLCRRAMYVVTEGIASQDHYGVAWQAFKQSLNKVRLVVEPEKHV